MDSENIDRIERLLERAISDKEKERLRRIQDTLGIKDNDGMWDVIIALEYQRSFYDELPEKIALKTAELLNGISEAAEKEVAKAQSRLAESVVEEARKLSAEQHLTTWVFWGVILLMAILIYGSLLLWAGYCVGVGKTLPAAHIFRMPVGVILGALCLGCGAFLGVQAGKKFAEGDTGWRKSMVIALGVLLPGAGVFISLAL